VSGLATSSTSWATALPALGGAWLRRSTEVVAASAEALNILNVFPVSDADTGSNLKLTLQGICGAVAGAEPRGAEDVVQAAILSAHGNSGAIVAEMVTSVCHAVPAAGRAAPSGALLAQLLRVAATAATAAVARPVAGTILTVADETARAAEEAAAAHPADALAVASAAQQGARTALGQTPLLLDVLGQAGVVDAGGQAFVLLVDVLVEVLGGPAAQPLLDVTPPRTTVVATAGPVEYEVMYTLHGASTVARDRLRAELSDLGSSVVVVGDESVAQVHVHLTEAGAAVEAALGLGRLEQIRVTALAPARATLGRRVVSVVAGPGLAEAVRALGGEPVPLRDGHPELTDLTAAMEASCEDLVVLPNDMESLEMATHVAATGRAGGRRIAVIPTIAQVQGLAAMAVHEPTADFDATVIAMSRAAGHTRHGALTVAESATMTMTGRCDPGQVLGLVEGDFVEIGDDPAEVGWRVLRRLMGAGGELLTLVAGADAPAGLTGELARRVREADPRVEIEVLEGGQSRYLVLLGLE